MQRALSHHHTFALVTVLIGESRKVGSMCRRHRFLHLQEQRIVVTYPEQQYSEGPGPHRTDPDDTVCHIYNMIAAEHHSPFR